MFTSFTVKSQDVPQNIELKGANEPRSQIGAIWQFLGQLASIALLAFVSTRFLPAWLAATTALLLSTILFFLFKKQIESYYSWFEKQFLTGISDEGSNSSSADNTHHHLIPWDAHLAEIKLTNNSKYLGKTLKDAKIREKFSINLVVIRRGDDDIVAPGADERLFPGDCLLCFGSDDDLEKFRTDMLCKVHKDKAKHETLDYGLRALEIKTPSPATNFTIREAKIKEVFGCLIVGIERAGTRIANPDSNTHIKMGDLIWLVGDHNQLDSLQNYLQPEN
jgi:CPA2 family monovalent cation:H+ antiporter-2